MKLNDALKRYLTELTVNEGKSPRTVKSYESDLKQYLSFLEDLTDYDELRGMFRSLSRTLSERLRKAGKAGCLVSIRIKYYDFSVMDRSARVKEPVWKADDIYVQAISLFNDNWDQEPVRLLGISVSDFEKEDVLASQINLFDESIARREETISVLNELNKELGGMRLVRASEAYKDEAE